MNVVLISKSYDDLLQLVANLRELKEREGEGEGGGEEKKCNYLRCNVFNQDTIESEVFSLAWVQRLYKLLCEREEKRERA